MFDGSVIIKWIFVICVILVFTARLISTESFQNIQGLHVFQCLAHVHTCRDRAMKM